MNFYYCLIVFAIGFISSGLAENKLAEVSGNYSEVVTLDCPLGNTGVTWFRSDANTTIITTDKKYIVNEQGLTVFDLRYADLSNTYTCKKGNEAHEFKIITPPKLYVSDKKSETQTEGMDVEFECKLVAGYQHDQPLEWKWFAGANEILNKTNKYEITISANKSSSGLSVRSVTQQDNGIIKCVPTNGLGNDKQEILLRVKNTLAALWPFIGIIIEVAVLCVIILVFEKKCGKKAEDESEPSQSLMAAKDTNNDGPKKRSGK